MVGLPVLPSSEQVEVTSVAYSTRCLLAPYFWGLRVLLLGREAAQLSLGLLLAVLVGAGGLLSLCSSGKKFLNLDPSLFSNFLFLGGDSVWGAICLC